MISSELLFALIAFAFVSSVTPGPNNVMLMSSGINFGFRRTIPHMLGVAIGFTLMILLVGAGIIQILNAIPGAHQAIRIASALYLLYMAWMIARRAPPPGSDTATLESSAKPFSFMQAALFQWINPKAWTMALTAVSAYIPQAYPFTGLLTVALVFGAINLPCTSSWAYMGTKLRRLLSDPAKLRAFNIASALILVGTLYPVVFGGR